MICCNCNKAMSHRGGKYYDCFNCGATCVVHDGGQEIWTDRNGNTIVPKVDDVDDRIKYVERTINELRSKR